MEEDIEQKIKEIMGEIKCPKNYVCVESGYENLCKAKDIRLESYLVCLDEHPQNCRFSVSVWGDYYCKCPLRVYIAKELRM